MSKLYLICIDDQPEVLNALEQDLEAFEELLVVEVCETGKEALDLIEEIDADGNQLAVVISDQVMPALTGVDILTTIEKDGRFPHTQKILLTGLATHEDTIEAINEGGVDNYIQKPWKQEKLIRILKKGLATFVVKSGIDYEPIISILDQETLYQALRNQS